MVGQTTLVQGRYCSLLSQQAVYGNCSRERYLGIPMGTSEDKYIYILLSLTGPPKDPRTSEEGLRILGGMGTPE